MRRTIRNLLPLCLVACVFVPATWKTSDRILQYLEDGAHAVVFALLAWWWVRHVRSVRSPADALRVGGVVAGTAALIELVQPMVGRTASMRDFYMGLAGIVIALFLLHDRPRWKPWTRAASLVLVLLLALPPLAMWFDRCRARAAVPLIASFESPLEVGRWEAVQCRVSRSRSWAADGDASLEIETKGTHPFQGVFLHELPSNWEEIEAFRLDLFNPGSTELLITLRMDDKENTKDYFDRFQREIPLGPGHLPVRITRKELAYASGGRAFNLAGIRSLGLFVESQPAGTVFHVDAVRLEK